MRSTNTTADRSPVICRGEKFDLYLAEEAIRARVQALGEAISQDYSGNRPVLVGILNGSFVFLADLMRAISIDCEVDFLKLSSYGAEKVSSGEVQELKKVDAKLEGRHVILVEDIVDTGLSISYMLERMQQHKPASVKVITLLHKYEATVENVQLDYVGFRIPDLFVIGYGLDYGQLGRNLRSIYMLSTHEGAEVVEPDTAAEGRPGTGDAK